MYKFILIILITANFTFASGHSTTIYDCAEFSGENQAAVHVVSHSTSPPGGPVKSWTEAIASYKWVGANDTTDKIVVTVTNKGAATFYSNKSKDFELIVFQQEVDKMGKIKRIDVSGNFISVKDARNFRISRRWIDCK
jgi:hypothetical protein